MRKSERSFLALNRRSLLALSIVLGLSIFGVVALHSNAQRSTEAELAQAASPNSPQAGTLIISEFRLRGPNGANDEFIEIYNNSGAGHTVASISGTGYGVAASDGVLRCTIPNATVIPAGGHFLCTNSVGYSYSAYPAGNGTTATGDATYATDIPDNAGIALFNNNSGGASFQVANRFDAVGGFSEANALYKEGTGYPDLTPFPIEYSFARKAAGLTVTNPPFGGVPTNGLQQDSDDNATDFIFVDTNGTSAGAGQRLGAPGPENLSSPIYSGATTPHVRLDATVPFGSAPNKVRDFTSVPAQNSTFGTIDLRRRFVNNTGANLTRLRLRILNIATFPAASGIADLRPITSGSVVVAGINDSATCTAAGQATPCSVTVQGTTLEVDNTAPSTGQPNGGGFNSSYGAATVTLGTPLANGASIDLRFLFGIQQTGSYKLAIVAEGLPTAGDLWILQGNTEDASDFEGVPTPTTAAQLKISEFRLRGPGGANDEFIELFNTTSSALLTQASDASAGLAVAASDGVTRCVVPNGTSIPPHGHFLCTNSVAYSLGGNATGNATYVTDIPDNAGIALFNNSTGGASFSLANRLDAVGSASEANALYKEGTGYPTLTPFSIDYSFARLATGLTVTNPPFGGSPTTGLPQDTDNNGADFYFVDTNGTSAGAGQRLGAPGPENLASPVFNGNNTPHFPLDSTVTLASAPNKVRDFTSVPAQNSTFGTVDLRRRYTNNTGGNLTRLRFRILNLATFPAASGIADLRPRTSGSVVVAGVNDAATCTAAGQGTPCSITVQGTTLEQPPSQPNGGGFNSTLSAATVTLGTPLANGASIDLHFLFGIQQTGSYKIAMIAEGLPTAGDMFILTGATDNNTDFEGPGNPTTTSVTSNANPSVFGQPVTFTATVVTSPPGGTPTGSVTFFDGASQIGAPVTLNGSGISQITTSDRTVGNHTISANYSGDVGNLPSTGNLTGNPQVVNKASTTAAITNDTPDPSILGQNYAVTAAVTVTGPGAGTPTGTITVTDGTNNCTITLPATSCNLPSTSTGLKTLTATYNGDGNFNASPASPGAPHVVGNTVSGNITQFGTNAPLQNVLLTLSGSSTATTNTDASGNYTLSVPDGTSITITPSLSGKVFEPISRSFSNLNTNISNANFLAYNVGAVPRVLSVVNTYVTPGQSVNVPVVMTSQGNEKSVSFSLNYDINPFASNPTAICGTSAPGCTVTFNNATAGKIGVTVTAAGVFNAGTREVAEVVFQSLPTILSNTPVTFGNSPTTTRVADTGNNPLPFTSADGFVVFAQGLEGDVAGRKTGNGQLEAGDVTVERQFVVGSLTPDPTFNEFQRADTSPGVTKGDGQLDATDVIQERRYVAALDNPASAGGLGGPPQPVLGAAAPPANEVDSAARSSRTMHVTSTDAVAGAKATVFIDLDTQGDEAAASFTLNFDHSKLSNPVIELGGGMSADTALTVNANSAADGKLGVLVDSANVLTAARILKVTFDVSPSAGGGETPVTFSSSLAKRSTSDANGNQLASNYENGTVKIAGSAATGVSVSGRVLSADGRGVRNAQVTITDQSGTVRTVTTSSFGFYQFDGVAAGSVYTLNVASRQFRFAARTVEVSDNLTDVDLVGLE